MLSVHTFFGSGSPGVCVISKSIPSESLPKIVFVPPVSDVNIADRRLVVTSPRGVRILIRAGFVGWFTVFRFCPMTFLLRGGGIAVCAAL